MDKYQEAIKVWRQRGLDFSRLGRTLKILEDRYRRDPEDGNPVLKKSTIRLGQADTLHLLQGM